MRSYKIILINKICSHLYSIVQIFSFLLNKIDEDKYMLEF